MRNGALGWESAMCPKVEEFSPILRLRRNLATGRFIGRSPKPLDYAYGLFPILRERRNQLGGT
jgi:ABC-type branched-subunit amino acid transport system ATPase component